MRIDSIISAYLENNRRVVIPGFGSLVRRPSGQLVFMDILKADDGVLASQISERTGISPEEAAKLTGKYAFHLKTEILYRKEVEIEGVGTIIEKPDGSYDLVPAEAPAEAGAIAGESTADLGEIVPERPVADVFDYEPADDFTLFDPESDFGRTGVYVGDVRSEEEDELTVFEDDMVLLEDNMLSATDDDTLTDYRIEPEHRPEEPAAEEVDTDTVVLDDTDDEPTSLSTPIEESSFVEDEEITADTAGEGAEGAPAPTPDPARGDDKTAVAESTDEPEEDEPEDEWEDDGRDYLRNMQAEVFISPSVLSVQAGETDDYEEEDITAFIDTLLGRTPTGQHAEETTIEANPLPAEEGSELLDMGNDPTHDTIGSDADQLRRDEPLAEAEAEHQSEAIIAGLEEETEDTVDTSEAGAEIIPDRTEPDSSESERDRITGDAHAAKRYSFIWDEEYKVVREDGREEDLSTPGLPSAESIIAVVPPEIAEVTIATIFPTGDTTVSQTPENAGAVVTTEQWDGIVVEEDTTGGEEGSTACEQEMSDGEEIASEFTSPLLSADDTVAAEAALEFAQEDPANPLEMLKRFVEQEDETAGDSYGEDTENADDETPHEAAVRNEEESTRATGISEIIRSILYDDMPDMPEEMMEEDLAEAEAEAEAESEAEVEVEYRDTAEHNESEEETAAAEPEESTSPAPSRAEDTPEARMDSGIADSLAEYPEEAGFTVERCGTDVVAASECREETHEEAHEDDPVEVTAVSDEIMPDDVGGAVQGEETASEVPLTTGEITFEDTLSVEDSLHAENLTAPAENTLSVEPDNQTEPEVNGGMYDSTQTQNGIWADGTQDAPQQVESQTEVSPNEGQESDAHTVGIYGPEQVQDQFLSKYTERSKLKELLYGDDEMIFTSPSGGAGQADEPTEGAGDDSGQDTAADELHRIAQEKRPTAADTLHTIAQERRGEAESGAIDAKAMEVFAGEAEAETKPAIKLRRPGKTKKKKLDWLIIAAILVILCSLAILIYGESVWKDYNSVNNGYMDRIEQQDIPIQD